MLLQRFFCLVMPMTVQAKTPVWGITSGESQPAKLMTAAANLRDELEWRILPYLPQDGPALRIEAGHVVVIDFLSFPLEALRTLEYVRETAEGKTQAAIIVLAQSFEDVEYILKKALSFEDFILNPFSPEELSARAMFRVRHATAKMSVEEKLRVGPVEILPSCHQVIVNGRTITMTDTPYRVLIELVRADGRVLSRNELMDRVWDCTSDSYINTVDVAIHRLRHALQEGAGIVETVRSVGYRIRV